VLHESLEAGISYTQLHASSSFPLQFALLESITIQEDASGCQCCLFPRRPRP
jgi:hypothetical protein